MVSHQKFTLWIETNECGQPLSSSSFFPQAEAAFVSVLSAGFEYMHILHTVIYLLCQVIQFPV